VFLFVVGGTRDGGGAWGDVLGHDGVLETFPILLDAAIGAAAFLGVPHCVKAAAIGAVPAAFLSGARFLLGLFKASEAGTDAGESGG